MSQKICCDLSCDKPADWDIFDDGNDPYSGTQACNYHLAKLMGAGWHTVAPANWDDTPE